MQNYPAAVGLFQSGHDAKNSCLPASGSAQQNQRFAFGDVKADVFEHARFLEPLAEPAHAGRDPGFLFPVGRPRHVYVATLGSQFHSRCHASWVSNSSQSRAKNSTLKITNDKSARTIAIAFAASR